MGSHVPGVPWIVVTIRPLCHFCLVVGRGRLPRWACACLRGGGALAEIETSGQLGSGGRCGAGGWAIVERRRDSSAVTEKKGESAGAQYGQSCVCVSVSERCCASPTCGAFKASFSRGYINHVQYGTVHVVHRLVRLAPRHRSPRVWRAQCGCAHPVRALRPPSLPHAAAASALAPRLVADSAREQRLTFSRSKFVWCRYS